MAQGGSQAAAEAELMIAEKIAAFVDAEAAIAQALSAGEGFMVPPNAATHRCAGAWAPTAAAWRARWRDRSLSSTLRQCNAEALFTPQDAALCRTAVNRYSFAMSAGFFPDLQ